jgi:hypothetical protein
LLLAFGDLTAAVAAFDLSAVGYWPDFPMKEMQRLHLRSALVSCRNIVSEDS